IWLTLRHPNVLQFLGANTLDNTPFVVMPYISNNARQFLQKQTTFEAVHILRDVSLGLQYLHSHKIAHGDLKGVNVLVEDTGRALLCDFGLSRIKTDVTSRTVHMVDTILAGSRNWMAPELLAGSLPKAASDVYAFGMTLYELYAGQTPMANIPHASFVEMVYQLGVRPERPDIEDIPRLSDQLWNLAKHCWLKDPKARPTAGQIHDQLVDIIGTRGHHG
ncbi:kinase-like protein, partial [Mycena epipterygia]